jgi:hypothetical protein
LVGGELRRLLVLVLREDGVILHGYLCRVKGKDLGERGHSSGRHGLDWLGRLSEGVCEVWGNGYASEDGLEIKDGLLLLLLLLWVLLAEVIGFLDVGVRHSTRLVRFEGEIGPEIKLVGEIRELLTGEQIAAIVHRLWRVDNVQSIQVCRRHVSTIEEGQQFTQCGAPTRPLYHCDKALGPPSALS